MIYDLPQFMLGVLAGVVGFGIALSFTAALVTFAGADSDKRGLSGRHSARTRRQDELRAYHFATLPVVAPRKRKRSRPESTSGVLPPS